METINISDDIYLFNTLRKILKHMGEAPSRGTCKSCNVNN